MQSLRTDIRIGIRSRIISIDIGYTAIIIGSIVRLINYLFTLLNIQYQTGL